MEHSVPAMLGRKALRAMHGLRRPERSQPSAGRFGVGTGGGAPGRNRAPSGREPATRVIRWRAASTLNRFELGEPGSTATDRYKRIVADFEKMDVLFGSRVYRKLPGAPGDYTSQRPSPMSATSRSGSRLRSKARSTARCSLVSARLRSGVARSSASPAARKAFSRSWAAR